MAKPEHLAARCLPLKRWGMAAAAGLCICALWFAYLDRDGCWLYWRGVRGLALFIFPCLWLTLLFGFRTKGRPVLIAISVIGFLFWPYVINSPKVFPAESSTVATLRHLRSILESYKMGRSSGYPRTLPHIDSREILSGAYRFEYLPFVSANEMNVYPSKTSTPLLWMREELHHRARRSPLLDT